MAPETAAATFVGVPLPGTAAALDRQIAHGLTWIVAVKAITVAASWACTIALARILSPQDYGLVTMGTVYVGLISMITDLGLGAAIVALPELSESIAEQLHTFMVIFGGVAFLLSCAAAVPVSRFFRAPALIPIVMVLSTLLIFDSLRLVPTSRFGRDLRFKDLALLDGYRVVVALIFAVPMALLGARYWALVWGNVLAAAVMTVIVLAKLPQRFGRPSAAELKPALKFSSHFLANQLAWYGYTNADFTIAGRILGKVALGEYTLAWSIVCAAGDKILAIFGRVMPMVLSNVQRDVASLRRYFLLFTELLAILILPACAGLVMVSRDFVLLLFGAKWLGAVLPLQLLSVFMAVHVLGTPADRLLQSAGEAAFPARCRLVMLVALLVAFFFSGSRFGTSGIALVWVTLYPALLLPMFIRVFRSVGIAVRDYAMAIGPTIVSTAAMVAVVYAVRQMITADAVALRFAIEVAAGLTALLLCGFSLQRERIAVLSRFVRGIPA